MYGLGRWFAVLAPVLWFGAVLWLAPSIAARGCSGSSPAPCCSCPSRSCCEVEMTDASVPAGAPTPHPDAAAPPTTQPAERRRGTATPLWLAITIAVVFGVFYAYDVWEAVGNLVGLNLQAGALGVALTGFGWALLVAGARRAAPRVRRGILARPAPRTARAGRCCSSRASPSCRRSPSMSPRSSSLGGLDLS